MEQYPNWIDPSDGVNLRGVAPVLFIGATGGLLRHAWPVVLTLCPCNVEVHGAWRVRKPMADGDPIPEDTVREAIELYRHSRRVNQPMLVHCRGGLTRAAAVGLILLCREDQVMPEEAYRRVYCEGVDPESQTFKSVSRYL